MSQAPVVIQNKPADNSKNMGMIYALATSFFLLLVVLYMLFQVFAPEPVREGTAPTDPNVCDRRPADNVKCFNYSFVIDIVVFLVVWVVYALSKSG